MLFEIDFNQLSIKKSCTLSANQRLGFGRRKFNAKAVVIKKIDDRNREYLSKKDTP